MTDVDQQQGVPKPPVPLEPWRPTVQEGDRLEDVPLSSWVGEALGAASMCWTNVAGAGVFDGTRCAWVLQGLMMHLNSVIDGVIEGTRKAEMGPLLGLATTRHLLEELVARWEAPPSNEESWANSTLRRMCISELAEDLEVLPEAILEYRTVDG